MKVHPKAVFVVAMTEVPIDLPDGRVETRDTGDEMMVVRADHDSVLVDLEEAELLSRGTRLMRGIARSSLQLIE